MIHRAGAVAFGAVLLLAGCADQMVELPNDRRPALLSI
jgi:hypothetical protein